MKKELHFFDFRFIFACVLNMQAQSFETDIARFCRGTKHSYHSTKTRQETFPASSQVEA